MATTTGSAAPKWADDLSSDNCTACKVGFTFFNRRHHCRRCGGLFCNDCCGLSTSLPQQFGQKSRARVCNKCFKLTIRERIKIPNYTSIADSGPSAETKVVSSMQKMLYWKMGAHDGGMFDRSIVDVAEGATGPIAVQQVQDLMIESGENHTVRMRVLTPSRKWKGSEKRAMLVWFHTGHFCTRGIESPSVDGLCRLLANQIPSVVVSVDYRLAPEHPYPAALDDAYAAVCWAINNAANFESDATLVSVGGDGAGGNLAAAVTLMARDKGLPGGAKLLSQVLITPPLDLTTTANYDSRQTLKNAPMLPLNQFQWFVSQYISRNDPTSQYISPLLANDLSNLPPALVIAAGHDVCHSEDKAYALKLANSGVRTIFTLYSNSCNGFFGSGLDESDEAVMEVVLYLSSEIMSHLKK